jgi:xanthine dehydrogenase molybdenum-binding subunit
MAGQFRVLGKSFVRKDAIEKVAGNARYISDIQLPEMLTVKFLRSPHAHARIKDIDTSAAERLPGIKCVLTFKNIPKLHAQKKLEYVLDEYIHHPGQEVAAVAAVSAEIAEEALRLIKVEFEVLPAVFTPEEALAPGAPLVHPEYDSNIYHGTPTVKISRLDKDYWLRLEVGDVEKGFAQADHILDGTYQTPIQYNCSPMPRGVICEWIGDKLTCWADTQLPLPLIQDLARNLKVPQSNIRLTANYAVGGYGGKTPEKTAVIAAIMAKRTRRPVKAVFSRTEDFIGTHHRISYDSYNKIGVKTDGSITAIYSRIVANWGADTVSQYICQSTGILNSCTMLYKWQNSKAETLAVLTNTLDHGAMNGFGDPEAIFCIERLVDQAAEKINMDPVEFRLKNCVHYGDKATEREQVLNGPIEWGILGQDMESFPELIQKAREASGWRDKWKGWRTPAGVNGHLQKGIGVAIGIHHTTFWPCSAIVKMNQDGTANVLSGAVEIGQGYATAISQVVAETLGIRYEDVSPVLADTAVTPAARGNVASTGVSSAMNAARIAAEDARRRLCELAAPRLNASPEDLEAREGRIWVKGSDRSLPIADICFTNWQITGVGNNPPYRSIKDKETGKTINAFAAAVAIAEVEVDVNTGKVELTRITAGNDSGVSINPVIVENQIDMGLTMANGWARTEEFIVDPRTGVIINPNLLDYKLSTFLDMPKKEDLRKIIVERPCAWGPFGAKGMSETPMTALAPAIANAVYNAVGVRLYAGLCSPANILEAIAKAKEG